MCARSSLMVEEGRARWVSGLVGPSGEGGSRRRRSSKRRAATRPGPRSDGSVRGAGIGAAREWPRPAPGGVTTPRPVASPRHGREPRADWSTDSARSGRCVFDLRCWWKKIEHTSASNVVPSAAVCSAAPNGSSALARPDLSKPDTHPEQTSPRNPPGELRIRSPPALRGAARPLAALAPNDPANPLRRAATQ